jgi:GNAT superfamily N-acetyltransferase
MTGGEETTTRIDPAWPVGILAQFEVATLPGIRFTAIADRYHCSVHALKDLIVVGSLRWGVEQDDDSAAVGALVVTPEYRRRGIATGLWAAAHAYAERYGLPAPRHSEERSDDGDAWARSVGGELPPRVASAGP